jgi:hypothetical protein
MTRLLIDPLLLVPFQPSGQDVDDLAVFVERLSLWAADQRASVGTATLDRVCSHYARTGYPETPLAEDTVPRFLRQEFARSLNQVLGRVIECGQPVVQHLPSPSYRGPVAFERALVDDLAGAAQCVFRGIATDSSHWDPASATLILTPGPPERSELCSIPGACLEFERDAELQSFFANKRIHVVGGRPRDAVPTRLAKAFGVDPSSVVWMPAEKGKPPRGIRGHWAGLEPERDITACLTGCIGHSEAEVAARASAARGTVHVKAETVDDLLAQLRDIAAQVDSS